VGGCLRHATASDRELLVGWFAAFFAEAMAGSVESDAVAAVDRKLAEPEGGFAVWEDGGSPVSFAGYGSPTPNGMRIGPVYTPPGFRGRGYGSAVTAGVTGYVLGHGRRFCFLYTDLSNPTSNSIYQRIGYRPVIDVNVWRFAGRAAP
jgi:predicted GNAT family acetyltransferase